MHRIVIEIGHPGQVHQFHYVAKKLLNKGHKLLFVTRDKDLCVALLKAYNLPYKISLKTKKGIFRKLIQLPFLYFRFLAILLKFKPTIILSRFSPQSCHIGWLLRVPVIGFDDSEHAKLMVSLSAPFAKVKITSTSYTRNLGRNHYRFNGNIELFYLHPAHFTPDSSILNKANITQPFALLRFVAWGAYHDIGQGGISLPVKQEMVKLLSEKMRVYITSEGKLPDEFKQYKTPFHPKQIHSVLAFAEVYVGEGATMASEAALVGTPAIYVNSLTAGSIEDAANNGLIRSLRNDDKLIESLKAIIDNPNSKRNYIDKRDKYIENKCDITEQIVWFVDQYPMSLNVLQKYPNVWIT